MFDFLDSCRPYIVNRRMNNNSPRKYISVNVEANSYDCRRSVYVYLSKPVEVCTESSRYLRTRTALLFVPMKISQLPTVHLYINLVPRMQY